MTGGLTSFEQNFREYSAAHRTKSNPAKFKMQKTFITNKDFMFTDLSHLSDSSDPRSSRGVLRNVSWGEGRSYIFSFQGEVNRKQVLN